MAIKPIMLQRQLTEVGRIRIGNQVEGQKRDGGTYTRPAKLDTFRFTSISQPLIESVAAEYGGDVAAWTPAGGGPSGWEVISETANLPVLVPPQDVGARQYMEQWAGGRCTRRCDGETELLTNLACICVATDDMRCKPKTRLSVMLRDIEGVGTWRIESNGWGTAGTLPGTADFLMQHGGYVSATLYLQPRSRVVEVNGKPQTQSWMVPALIVKGITPGELNSGTGGSTAAVGQNQQQAVGGQAAPAIEAPAPAVPAEQQDPGYWVKVAEGCQTTAQLTEQLSRAQAAGFGKNFRDTSEPVGQAFIAAKRRLDAAAQPAPVVVPPADPAALWSQIVAAGGARGFDRTSDLEDAFAHHYEGATPGTADVVQLEEFLKDLQGGRIHPSQPVTVPAGSGADEPVPF